MPEFDNFFSKPIEHYFDPLNITGADPTARNAAYQQAADYRNGAPRPAQIQWNPIYDPMSMADHTQIDPSGLQAFKGQALSKGPSQWATQANAQQEALSKNALDMGAKSVVGQGATARSQLAMRGGLSGGARERVAMEGQNNFMNMAQGVGQQKSTNQMQIGMNDQQNKLQMMSQLPGMQQNAAQFQSNQNQFNTGAQMANNQSRNAFDLGQYQSQMAAYGAGQTAAATAQAGKHKK